MRTNLSGSVDGSHRGSSELGDGNSWMLPSWVCYCGKVAKIQTSWTSSHLGRRFYVCAQKRCQMWEWGDAVMCNRSKQIISGLLRRINKLEAEKMKGNSNLKNPWFWVSLCMFGVIMCLISNKDKCTNWQV
ncbi:hypothetical protein CerSpe_069060 [Prunus speciosa]